MQVKMLAIPLLALTYITGLCFADRPPGSPPGEGRPGQDGPRRGGRERGSPPWRNDEPISDAYRKEVEEFWKDAAPNRWAAYEKLDDADKKEHVFAFMVGYYRGLGWLKQDEELFKARKKQIGIEDAIFAIQRKYKDVLGEESNDPKFAEARAALEKAAGDLFDAQLEERGLRVQRLETHLKDEKEKLARDTADRNHQVKEMLDRLLRGKPAVPPPGMRGPDRDREGRDRNGRDKPDKRPEKKDGEKGEKRE